MGLCIAVVIAVFLLFGDVLVRAALMRFGIARYAVGSVSRGTAIGLSFLIWLLAIGALVAVLAASNYNKILEAVGPLPATLAATWIVLRWRLGARPKLLRIALLCLLGSVVFAAVVSVPAIWCMHRFLAEAFVLPTGSMAPTFYGWHSDVHCANCGLGFAVSMSDRGDRTENELRRPIESKTAICPNCGAKQILGPDAPLVRGDCILADKLAPWHRWDIVVFNLPTAPQIQYDKRLVGLPGEEIELVGEDVFVDGRRLRKRAQDAPDAWFPICDTHYVPAAPSDAAPAWSPIDSESTWRNEHGQWSCDGSAGDHDVLTLKGILTDALACNATNDTSPQDPAARPRPVEDIKLDCDLHEMRGNGGLTFSWSFGDRSTSARVSAGGEVLLTASATGEGADQPATTATGKLPNSLDKGGRLAFVQRDGWAYVMFNEQPIAEIQVKPDDIATAKKEFERAFATSFAQHGELKIQAHDCHVVLARLAVSRDLCYVGVYKPFADAKYGMTNSPIKLGPEEYYVLGDNSRWSMDSRIWGPVPRPLMDGVVRWRYWPFSRWRWFP